ncbi:PQQ-binding-like beta-propeller repeat protein [Rapidithrix thailandica]|uniref:PQQ-binding-like beta-propeller repeat protein n=1 Tax=Rapidithrix thailandica TaxID=413964 RepID=A0AAW9S8R2_9BACT
MKILPLYLWCLALGVMPLTLQGQKSWSVQLPGIGTFSSPRVADLNQDGVGDIILGAGRKEFQACDSAMIALDGRHGKLLWQVSAKDQIFGSAALKDLNGDGIPDILIGGRSAELKAIHGKTGELLWQFSPENTSKTSSHKWYNFYNPQWIPDQNQDGLEEVLISNGGDVMAAAYDPDRPPGYLLVLSGKDGRLLAQAEMPDGKETYMSVAITPANREGDYKVIFGTGGETVGGNLYVGLLSQILKGDLSEAKLLDSSPAKGYIAPPVWVDINQDQVPDILANSVDGRLLAFDGKTYQALWSVHMPNTEAYSSIATGYFTKDSIPDFFVSYAQGAWPKLEWCKQFMVNGQTGKLEFVDSLGFYQTSTPVAADITKDGRDEAFLSVNIKSVDEQNLRTYFYNVLVFINFSNRELVQVGPVFDGSNISSTPWLGDLDQDGFMDIIYCHATNTESTYTFDGLQINRIATEYPMPAKLPWGAYMGSAYDGVFYRDQ